MKTNLLKYFKHRFKIVNKISFLLIFFSIAFISVLIAKQVISAPPIVSIISAPAPKSNDLPSLVASATADPGKTINSAAYQIYPSGSAPSGPWYDCIANGGFSFGNNYVEFSCIVPSLADGSYKMNIRAIDSDASIGTTETSAFIVDRIAPVITFHSLPNAPYPINFNDPVFTGTSTDAWTNVVSVEYKWMIASTTSPVPPDFGDSGWTACTVIGSGTEVGFSCDPAYNFPNSVKGDEYRMHVRTTDEIGNLSGFTNYYKFQVDTINPYNLTITYPTDAGITLYGGQSYNITWTTPVDDFELGSQPIKLEYSASGLFNDTQLIADNRAPAGPYSWTVPGALDTTTARVRITATDLAGNSITSTSANPFTVIPYSAPVVTIYPITNNITSTSPITITALATDPQNIMSADFRIGAGAWSACSATDGSFGGSSENLTCGPFTTSQGSRTIEIRAYDSLGDVGSNTYNFIYDATPPVVDAGSLGTINTPTIPNATATDAHSSIASRLWTQESGPGTINFGGGTNILNPSISADINGEYTARLTACDLAGNCASDTVTFTWTDQPLDFAIITPNGTERLRGGLNFNITWSDPSGAAADHFDVKYSTNGGSTWTPIVNSLPKTTLNYNWTVPAVNSTNVIVNVSVYDSGDNFLTEANSNPFIIDSTPPIVDAGSLGTISSPTAPGASASDNFDSPAQLTYAWTQISGPGVISFGGGSNIVNPTLSGTVNGSYTARLTVTDRAGNTAYDEVTFTWSSGPTGFSVLSPSGGSFIRGGTTIPVVWTVASGASYYQLEYTINNGGAFTTIIASTTGTATSSGLYYNWNVPAANSSQSYVRVTAYDTYGNNISTNSGTFTIDSTPPVVSAGFLGSILSPTIPNATASDSGSGLASLTWTQINGPGTINFGGGANILNPLISASETGVYTARLTAVDNVGLSAYSEVSFFFSIEPPAPVITSPGADEFWRGSTSRNIRWTIQDPGDLLNFSLAYSLNNGADWTSLGTVSSSTRLFTWEIPVANTTEAVVRIVVNDTEGYSATSTRQFTIDSTPPVINLGSIGTTTVATTSGTTVTDNIDSPSDLTYIWTQVAAPSGGTLVFTPSHSIMDPSMAATVTGYYSAQIIAQDRAGHISQDILTFYWDGDPTIPIVTLPNSTVFVQGGDTQNIEWFLPDSGLLSHFNLSYSLNNGASWFNIANVASTTREYAWTIPVDLNSSESLVKVVVYDIYSNSSEGISANFTIDSTAPIVNAGTITSPISQPTVSTGVTISDNIDSLNDLTILWSALSKPYPAANLIISDAIDPDTEFAGDMTGEYTALLTVTDRSGNVGTSTVTFFWQSPYDPEITKPAPGDILRGSATTTVAWNMEDSGILSHLEVEYSIDNGENWIVIDNNIVATSRFIVWTIPSDTNSQISLARILAVDNLGRKATSTSGLFTIDSTPPTVSAGSFSGYTNTPTAPGASASDNFDSPEQLTYNWTQVSAPSNGTINFGGGSNILNPTLSGNRNGTYTALLSVYDRAGNYAGSTVSFERSVSSGGGGGGSAPCLEVTYGPWGECFAGVQYRSIISSQPPGCSPTAAQQALQQQVCDSSGGGGGDNYCTEVTYSAWGDCINNVQSRTITGRQPANCNLTASQLNSLQQSCSANNNCGPFDCDAGSIMEAARRAFTREDKQLVERLRGQILIQVEEHGRAWYVNASDGKRYYLGSPLNAFSVMSVIGNGIKNEHLNKMPIGLLDGLWVEDKDSDGDGLPDRLEEAIGTDPFKVDTDGDGYDDYTEVVHGYDPLGPSKMVTDPRILQASLGHIFIQVETNGEAWYVEPRTKKRYYLGRPLEALGIMREFGVGITNEDLNKIPVAQFTSAQMARISRMLEERQRQIDEARARGQ